MSGSRIKQAILFVNLKKENASKLADEITGELRCRGIEATNYHFEEKSKPGVDYDVAFSVGGDGTVLYATRIMAPLGVPVLPINQGTLGFIAAVHPQKWKIYFDSWLEGKAALSKRLMLEAFVKRGDREIFRMSCLNDIVISASGNARMIRLQVYTNIGNSKNKLGQYRSDGLIIATPTGSTAYSVAAGGPVMDPEMEAIIINPICPFTLSNRPIVLPAHETVIVEVEQEQRSALLLSIDGQVTEPLEPGDCIFVSPSPKQAILIASDRFAFYHALRAKLSWMELPGNVYSQKETDGVSNA